VCGHSAELRIVAECVRSDRDNSQLLPPWKEQSSKQLLILGAVVVNFMEYSLTVQSDSLLSDSMKGYYSKLQLCNFA
jgi:hypothetical protein